jgi:hypothetical protein
MPPPLAILILGAFAAAWAQDPLPPTPAASTQAQPKASRPQTGPAGAQRAGFLPVAPVFAPGPVPEPKEPSLPAPAAVPAPATAAEPAPAPAESPVPVQTAVPVLVQPVAVPSLLETRRQPVPAGDDLVGRSQSAGRHFKDQANETRAAFEQRQLGEREDFEQSLKGKSFWERRRLRKAFNTEQSRKKKAFNEQQEKKRRMYEWRFQ